MSEQREIADRCAACPDRSCVSRILAKVTGIQPPEDCAGPTTVHRGEVKTTVVQSGQPQPAGTWETITFPTSGAGPKHYNRVAWEITKQCGRDEVKPAAREVPYAPPGGSNEVKNSDGSRDVFYLFGLHARDVDATLGALSGNGPRYERFVSSAPLPQIEAPAHIRPDDLR